MKKLFAIFLLIAIFMCIGVASASSVNDTSCSGASNSIQSDVQNDQMDADAPEEDNAAGSDNAVESSGTAKMDSAKTLKTATQTQSKVYVSKSGKDSNSGSKSSPKATISNALTAVSNGGTICLSSGTYYENGIYINKNVAIIGDSSKNTIINGQQNHVFTIKTNVNVKFQSITITNAKDKNGAAIYNKGSLKLQSVVLSSNRAVSGGAIYNKGKLTVFNSEFSNNKATSLGGAVYSTGSFNINNTKFNKNSQSAIYASGSKKNIIKNSKFTSNIGVNGGAILNGAILGIDNCLFDANKASQYGGAIYNKKTLNLVSSKLANNYAVSDGGAVYTKHSLYAKSATFNNNTSKRNGGAIYNSAKLTVKLSKFTLNDAYQKGGAIANLANNGNVKIESTTFSANVATKGGAVYTRGKVSLKISASTFTGNKNNALYIKSSLESTIYNNTFKNNYALGTGGCVYISKSVATFNKNSMISNTATESGAAIYSYKSKISVTNSILLDNNKIDLYNYNGKANASCNWWGNNKKPSSARQHGVNVINWIYLKVDVPSKAAQNNTASIKVSLYNVYNGKTFKTYNTGKYLPKMSIKLTINGGGVSKTYNTVITNSYTVSNKFTSAGSVTVKAYTKNTWITSKFWVYKKTTPITGLFVQIGASVTSSTVKKWASAGVTDVYVQTKASTNNTAKLKAVIKLCKNTNIRVHAWVICFSTDNGFDISAKQQAKIKNFISSVVKISGISGVCLDYVRYSGTNPSIVKPSKITNFVKAVNKIVKSKNSNLVVSACVFAEKSGTKTYYGQDYAALSPYVDVMLPMAYKYDYNSGRNWLKDVTSYVVKRAKYSQVVTVLQTYKYSSGSGLLSASELTADAKAVMSAGSNGYCLFRYGLVNKYPTAAGKLA